MRMWAPMRVFDQREEDLIHQTMLRIMDEVGIMVENGEILERLAAAGARADKNKMRVTFSKKFMEEFIASSDKFDWESLKPGIWGFAGTYFGYYLNPETDEYEPWTINNLMRFLKVAHYLEHTQGEVAYAYPIEGIPNEALVLFFHYLSLKVNGWSACSLNNVSWCPYVLQICEAAADQLGVPVGSIFRGHVHMISPLKLGREEASIFAFFAGRGLQVGIANMVTAGATAPVTLAGAIAIHLAEALFVNILKRVYFGTKRLGFGCEISALDMRTTIHPYGRPEKEMCNVAVAQMARRYRAAYGGHTGHADAKRPSAEAGFQRALRTIPTLMSSGLASVCCGLLSVDEVYSPIQMIIDDEIVSALQRFIRAFEVSEETLAFDLIKEIGPGGQFLDSEHTARHYRSELWDPHVFSRQMFAAWQAGGGKTDVDIAMDIHRDFVGREPMPVKIPEKLENELLDIIKKATGIKLQPVKTV